MPSFASVAFYPSRTRSLGVFVKIFCLTTFLMPPDPCELASRTSPRYRLAELQSLVFSFEDEGRDDETLIEAVAATVLLVLVGFYWTEIKSGTFNQQRLHFHPQFAFSKTLCQHWSISLWPSVCYLPKSTRESTIDPHGSLSSSHILSYFLLVNWCPVDCWTTYSASQTTVGRTSDLMGFL